MLQNIDCNYIKVDSSVFTAVLEDISSYKSIKVDIKKNCCESLVYSSEIILSDLNWNIKLFKVTQETPTIEIKEFYVKNILTGIEEKIPLEYGYNSQNCTLGFEDIEDDIISWLTARGVSEFPTFSMDTDSNGDCIFSIIDLPMPFVMTKMVYIQGGISYDRYFTYSEVGTGLFISGESLYISPAIIDDLLSSFTDGVYTVDITYVKNNNSTIVETSCLFLDCTIKCKVAAKIDTLKTDTTLHIIYFALLEASNCSCQCDKMCKLYEQLLIELGITLNTSDCGC